MSKYYSLEQIKSAITVKHEKYGGTTEEFDLFKLLQMPPADVVPVKRGKWIETDAAPHRVYCSECYKTFIPNKEWIAWKENMIPRNYCPACGARMDGDTDA